MSPEATDDAALVRRALVGEARAFGALYERHADRVHRFLSFRVGDQDVATDLTQDIFVSALTHLASLRQPERFASWLMQVARNRLLNYWAGAGGRTKKAGWEEPAQDWATQHAASDPALVDPTDMADAVGRRLELASVLEATRCLTDEQQEVLALRFAAGLSVAETAESVGRSEAAIKQMQHRAIRRLRDILARVAST